MSDCIVTEKICSLCKQGLPLEKFNKNRSKKFGVTSECRECRMTRRNYLYKHPIQDEPDLPDEIWMPCSCDTNYSVSNFGRVKRTLAVPGTRAGKLNKLFLDDDGYQRAHLISNKVHLNVGVHRLVAFAFLGDPPEGMNEVNHIDGDKTNNRVENLEWCNTLHNIYWRGHLGLTSKGSAHHMTKLTEDQIPVIRQMLTDGISGVEIGRRFGVSKRVISSIKKRKTWGHV